jgi:hypothetical protein
MTDKRRQLLLNLIETHGIYDASKIAGINPVELIHISEITIDLSLANTVLTELISEGKLPKQYKEFGISIDNMSGTVDWDGVFESDGVKENVFAYATPFWEGESGIPVEIHYYEEITDNNKIELSCDGDVFNFLKTREVFDGIEDVLTWYKHFYLPKVYRVIVEEQLPIVRKLMEEQKNMG